MCKRLVFLLVSVLVVSGAMAQQQVRVQFVNQYEAAIGKLSITSGGQTTAYSPDNLGYVIIAVNPADSLTIVSPDHEPHTIAGASVKENDVILLKKSFTWKDLLNPMFYIVYGGFFLLLFIVFAETGLFVG